MGDLLIPSFHSRGRSVAPLESADPHIKVANEATCGRQSALAEMMRDREIKNQGRKWVVHSCTANRPGSRLHESALTGLTGSYGINEMVCGHQSAGISNVIDLGCQQSCLSTRPASLKESPGDQPERIVGSRGQSHAAAGKGKNQCAASFLRASVAAAPSPCKCGKSYHGVREPRTRALRTRPAESRTFSCAQTPAVCTPLFGCRARPIDGTRSSGHGTLEGRHSYRRHCCWGPDPFSIHHDPLRRLPRIPWLAGVLLC